MRKETENTETGDVRQEMRYIRRETGDGSLVACPENVALLI